MLFSHSRHDKCSKTCERDVRVFWLTVPFLFVTVLHKAEEDAVFSLSPPPFSPSFYLSLSLSLSLSLFLFVACNNFYIYYM